MNRYKERAVWLPNWNKFIKQLFVSIVSYITLPFFKEKKDGIKLFFMRNYSDKHDDLVFDGTSSGYFSRITKLVGTIRNSSLRIIDLGCGEGSLYYWLTNNSFIYKDYIGVDFAIKSYLMPNAQFINGDFTDIDSYLLGEGSLIIMSNSLCYINDDSFIKILTAIQKKNDIIIIEPTPNIFWDAHFCGVRPVYRRIERTCELLYAAGFEIINTHEDFLFQLGSFFWGRLSYGIYARKTE